MENLEKNEVKRSQRDKPRHVPGEIIILMRQSVRNNLSKKKQTEDEEREALRASFLPDCERISKFVSRVTCRCRFSGDN